MGVARQAAITNHYHNELTPEERMDPRWHPDYTPTWDAFFINRRERALARHEEDGPPPSNFNEAEFRRNHGVSSLLNRMLGSVFTVKGGISWNLS
jgi:hypothetical protein